MLHSGDGVLWVLCCVGFVPNNILNLGQKGSILVSLDHQTFCHMASESPWWFFAYLKQNSRWAFLSNGFLLATLPYRPDLWSAWDIVVTCTQWPIFAIKACSSFEVAIGLSDQSPLCLVIQFGRTARSRQGLGGTIYLPLLNDCLDCAPRDKLQWLSLVRTCPPTNLRVFHRPTWLRIFAVQTARYQLLDESIRKFSNIFHCAEAYPFLAVRFQVFLTSLKAWWAVSWYSPYAGHMLCIQITRRTSSLEVSAHAWQANGGGSRHFEKIWCRVSYNSSLTFSKEHDNLW